MRINPHNYYSFRLTDEQEELTGRLLDFFDSYDEDIFIIKGYAGTGKTSIVKGFVKYLGENSRPFELLASTGRAAKVLAEKTNFPAATIHSTIYKMELVETGKDNYRIYFKLKEPNTNPKMIYFIDESSMLTNHIQGDGNIAFGTGRLLDDLFRFTGEGKVVFIGDPAQLPPVNSKFSAALNKNYLEQTFKKMVSVFELRQIMRYSGDSGISFNAKKLREQINSGFFPPLSIKAHDFNDIEVSFQDNDLVKKYYETIKRTGVESAVYITLSNKQAALVNQKVRSFLWGYNNLSQIRTGEALMVVRNNYLHNLSNGDLVIAGDIEGSTKKVAGLTFRNIQITVTDPDPKKGLVIKNVLIIDDLLSSPTRDLGMEQEKILLKDFFIRMTTAAGEIFELMTRGQPEALIKEVLRRNNIKNSPESINKFNSKSALARFIIRENMPSDPYLNALRVKYGYAVTCHKAQGSEWQHVFIHLERSMFYLDKENQLRWTYTALSRAEKKLYILNNYCLY